MAGYVLHLSTEENITLSSATVKRLIAGGSGDAALLYLAILHARGAADSGKLARELKWDETRLRAAEQALYEMKLVGALISVPSVQKKMKGQMTQYMVAPYEKVVEAAKKGKK